MKTTKVIVVLLVFILIVGVILLVPPSWANTFEAPFGQWRVELVGITEEGKTIPLNNGQTLSWTTSGDSVIGVKCKLYASAIGSGYDTCEILVEDTQYPGNPWMSCTLSKDGDSYSGSLINPTSGSYLLDVNGNEILFMEHTQDLDEFTTFMGGGTSVCTLSWMFSATPLKYRGIYNGTPDPWQEQEFVFTVQSGLEVTWSNDTGTGTNYVLRVTTSPYADDGVQETVTGMWGYPSSGNPTVSFIIEGGTPYSIDAYWSDSSVAHDGGIMPEYDLNITVDKPGIGEMYNIRVICNPAGMWADCSDPYEQQTGPSFSFDFARTDGNYVIHAYNDMFGERTRYVTVDGEDEIVLVVFPMQFVPKGIFSISVDDDIYPYRYENRYLGVVS